MFQGNVRLVELASLSSGDLVASTTASALGLKLGADGIAPESVSRAIGDRKLLLVLGNCEHVIDAAATLAEVVLRRCPKVSVLATSREALRIDGETVFIVPPLGVPPEFVDDPSEILKYGAVRFFVGWMHSLASGFSPSDDELSIMAGICRRLDGIPLAMEYSAARAAALGVAQVAANFDDRFNFLTGGRRTALPRQQTLRATLDWSYELLPEPERLLLRHLAIFPAGFTVEATAAVLDDHQTAAEVVTNIANLNIRSLVAPEHEPARWRLLETICAYAMDKLVAEGEAAAAARRQSEFPRDLCAPSSPKSLGSLDVGNLSRFVAEIDNVRAVLDWCLSPGTDRSAIDRATGVALTVADGPLWRHLSLTAEQRERTEEALRRRDPDFDIDQRLLMQLLLKNRGISRTRLQPGSAHDGQRPPSSAPFL